MPKTPSRNDPTADWAKPAGVFAEQMETINLSTFISEYLRNNNGLRDFMVAKVKNDEMYAAWCYEQAKHISGRQNHTDAGIKWIRKSLESGLVPWPLISHDFTLTEMVSLIQIKTVKKSEVRGLGDITAPKIQITTRELNFWEVLVYTYLSQCQA
jgi:hypothetical protein